MKLKNQSLFAWLNRVVFPLFYVRHQGKREVVHRVNGGEQFTIRVNSSDILVLWEVWNFKAYEPHGFAIQPDSTVLDIGGHIGSFAVYAAKRAPEGRVITCEPAPDNYRLLIQNITQNETDNITALNVAVSDKQEMAAFNIPASNGALGSLYQFEGRGDHHMVETLSLDQLVAAHEIDTIDLLKIDAEGAEYPILYGSSPDTLGKVRSIIMEYHDFIDSPNRHQHLEAYLREQGFTVETTHQYSLYHVLFGTGIMRAWRTPS